MTFWEVGWRMINEAELLTWLDSAKRAAKIPPIIPEGKYTMVVEVVPLLGKIRELSGTSESEVITIDEQAEAQAEV